MTETIARYRKLSRSRDTAGYGPYLLAEAMPWLFLAMAVRTAAFVINPAAGIVLYYSAQFMLMLAFLVASQRMINLLKGSIGIDKLPRAEQLRLSWQIIWRITLVGLIVAVIARHVGMPAMDAARFAQGLDGVAYNRFFDVLVIWSPCMAVLAFLMVVERGMGRAAALRAAVKQLSRRWYQMLGALLFIIGGVFVLNYLEGMAGPSVRYFVYAFVPARLHFIVLVTFFFIFTFARLWLTVASLTYALRLSYRNEG